LNAQSPVAGRPVVLSFCRNYLVESFRENAAPLAADYEFHFLTDGVCRDTPDTREAFYRALEAGTPSPELSAEDENDVIDRCRMLRRIDRGMARRLIHAMARALGEWLDRVRPAVILSQMVDEYVTHTLSLLAARRGIGYVGFCAGYFPGRSHLLADAYGRPFNWRVADDAEAGEMLERISPRSFRQNYNLRGDYRWSRHIYLMARYRAKRLGFAIRGRLEGDPWNIHYAVTPYIAERRRLRDYPRPSHFRHDWEAALAACRAERPGAPVVYLPLGFFPESTIDYWIANKRAIAYEPLVLEMVRTLTRDCIVIVKEHHHMMGIRDGDFLKALNAIPGAVSVHPNEFSNIVVEQSDAVLVGSGSPGIEATVRGKPVFSFCETSYWFEPSKATWLDLEKIEDWSTQIRTRLASFAAPDREDQLAFVRACLRCSTQVGPQSTLWPIMRPEDLRKVLATAMSRAGADPASATSL
jgi:hypothetical protein